MNAPAPTDRSPLPRGFYATSNDPRIVEACRAADRDGWTRNSIRYRDGRVHLVVRSAWQASTVLEAVRRYYAPTGRATRALERFELRVAGAVKKLFRAEREAAGG